MADLAGLEETLGIDFKDASLLEQALVHRSYLNENPACNLASNERLEFLGDAVLGFTVAGKLYHDYPNFTEGDMTRFRAVLVRRETLARMAETIGLGGYLFMGKGEEASGGRSKPANLASALEAVIAAIFLDRGSSSASDFIIRLLGTELKEVVSHGTGVDYKSRLQEFIQSREQQTPTYCLIEATGPDHGKTFTVEVKLGEIVLGRGRGKSKKAAETEAARSALEKLCSNFTE